MASVVIQYVDPDGTYILKGIRVRAGPGAGNGPGTLADEFSRGVRTPLASEADREVVLGLIDAKLKSFVRSLPAARLVPRQDAITSNSNG